MNCPYCYSLFFDFCSPSPQSYPIKGEATNVGMGWWRDPSLSSGQALKVCPYIAGECHHVVRGMSLRDEAEAT